MPEHDGTHRQTRRDAHHHQHLLPVLQIDLRPTERSGYEQRGRQLQQFGWLEDLSGTRYREPVHVSTHTDAEGDHQKLQRQGEREQSERDPVPETRVHVRRDDRGHESNEGYRHCLEEWDVWVHTSRDVGDCGGGEPHHQPQDAEQQRREENQVVGGYGGLTLTSLIG